MLGAMSAPAPRPPITGLVLAGGASRRMGGVDKGLLPLSGRPLVEWVLSRIRPQVDAVLISANRNEAAYAAFGHPVLRDLIPGFPGPLAGILRGLESAPTDLVLVVPCDTPFLPDDLTARLADALGDGALAVPVAGGRPQNAICLLKRDLAPDLAAFLAEGGRGVEAWQRRHRRVLVDFEDEASFFANLNSPDDLARLEGKRDTP